MDTTKYNTRTLYKKCNCTYKQGCSHTSQTQTRRWHTYRQGKLRMPSKVLETVHCVEHYCQCLQCWRGHHSIIYLVTPQKIACKNGKLRKIYRKTVLKIDKMCTKVPCTLCGCVVVYKCKQKAQLPQREHTSNITLSYGAKGILLCLTI